MTTLLRCLALTGLILLPSSSLFGIKIETANHVEFDMDLDVARTSETLKNMLEDIPAEAEEAIPLPAISSAQFELVLPAMQSLARQHRETSDVNERWLAHRLRRIVSHLKSNNQPLSNQQLIEFTASVNFLNVPLVQPALKVLAKRKLNKDELQRLIDLGDMLKDLWHIHPAMEMFSRQHPYLSGAIVNRDGKLISWSCYENTIKIWDINFQELTTLRHLRVDGVIESKKGALITWSSLEGTIKIWNINNLQAEPITLQDSNVKGVFQSRDGNLISWSYVGRSIKIWDINNLQAGPRALPHQPISGVMESSDGNLISWSRLEGRINIWNKNNFQEFTTLQHLHVDGVIESKKNLISWSKRDCTIKIWAKNTLQELITLHHRGIDTVMESQNENIISIGEGTVKIWDITNLQTKPKPRILPYQAWEAIMSRNGNLISWSTFKGPVQVWDKNTCQEILNFQHRQTVIGVIELQDGTLISIGGHAIKIWDETLCSLNKKMIHLLLIIYFVSLGQEYAFTAQELTDYKATFNTFSPTVQRVLETKAPDFIAAIQKA